MRKRWTELASTPWGEECIRVGEMVGRWWTETDFVVRDGRPVVAGLQVTARPPGQWVFLGDVPPIGMSAEEASAMKRRLPRQGLMSADLRKVPLGRNADALRDRWREFLEAGLGIDLYAAPPGRPTIGPDTPPKRWPHTRAEKADLAERYLAEPNKRKVNVLLAEAYRAQGMEISTTDITNRVRKLRNEGWLAAAPKHGLGGGSEGPELRKWWAEQKKEGKR